MHSCDLMPMEGADIIPDLDMDEADSIIADGKAVVLELWAPWCHPCELMKTVLERIIGSGKFRELRFIRVNADKYPESYEKYGARALPAIIGFANGEKRGKLIGFYGEGKTISFLEAISGGSKSLG